MNKKKARLKAIEQKINDEAKALNALVKSAEDSEDGLTDEVKSEIEQGKTRIKSLKTELENTQSDIDLEREIADLGNSLVTEEETEERKSSSMQSKSLGEQFIESDGYKRIKGSRLAGTWTSGLVELQTKATLTSTGAGADTAGGALIPYDVRPGVVDQLFVPNRVENLIASGSTNSTIVRYIVETVNSQGADVVAEGGEKPEASLEFAEETASVKKVAVTLPVSEEMVQDAPALASYISARLSTFVANKVDSELLEDLLAEVPVGNQDIVSEADSANAADAIYAGITKIRVSGLLEPSGIVVHPEDWAALRVAKVGASSDEYLAGSPFTSGPGQSLFGVPVVTSHKMTIGSALVGAFNTAAQVFSRGGLSVESTNSHGEDFTHNLIRIRAERRLALAVQRPAGFATADLSNGVS